MRRPAPCQDALVMFVSMRRPRPGVAPHRPWSPERDRSRRRPQGSSSRTARPAHQARRRLFALLRGLATAREGPGADPAAQPTLLVQNRPWRPLQDVKERGTPRSQLHTRSYRTTTRRFVPGQTPKRHNPYRLMPNDHGLDLVLPFVGVRAIRLSPIERLAQIDEAVEYARTEFQRVYGHPLVDAVE